MKTQQYDQAATMRQFARLFCTLAFAGMAGFAFMSCSDKEEDDNVHMNQVTVDGTAFNLTEGGYYIFNDNLTIDYRGMEPKEGDKPGYNYFMRIVIPAPDTEIQTLPTGEFKEYRVNLSRREIRLEGEDIEYWGGTMWPETMGEGSSLFIKKVGSSYSVSIPSLALKQVEQGYMKLNYGELRKVNFSATGSLPKLLIEANN